MQNNEQKVSPDGGDRCAKAVTDVAMQQVTPTQIKTAAAALANLMRGHDGSGSKIRASALSSFLSLPKSAAGDASHSDDESEEVESVGEEDVDKSRFLLSPKSLRSTESSHLDPETRARLRALLESTGLGKLSTADSKALADPEVLRRLTDKVNSAMDEAASTLMRIKAEQQKGSVPSSGNSGACATSSSDIDVVHLTLEDGQLCPAELEQALEGDSLLLMACSAGYYQLAEALLALKSDVEDRGTKGDRTPLMEAACGGYLDIVRLLITHKADVNAQAPSGNTALHYAACSGHVDVARELLEAGARVEEPNENGHTPLMEAATAGQVEIAALLLTRGANINTHSTEFKESALTLACYKGHLDMVKFLLEKGADLEHKTDEMHTALMEASMDGHVEVARLLLDRGAQVNMPADSFESPLTLAACGGHTELASLLIERGANLEEVNDEGYSPLMEAVREGHEDMVTLLIHRGADVNAQTEETQETALTLACCGGFLEIAELLVNSGANLELGCSTPLMEAAQEGHVELVKYLITAGAKVNAQTFTRGTALTYACENGHVEVAEVLVQHGAELDHESEGGRTALMRAAKSGHLRTVEFLVSKGACVNKVTSNNDHTVLSVACANGHLPVVEFLLRSGADFTHKLKDGSTMLIEAAKGGHFDIMNLLLDWPSMGANHLAALSVAGTGLDAASQLNKLSHDVSSSAVAAATEAKAAALAGRSVASVRDAPDGMGLPAKPAVKLLGDGGKDVVDLTVPLDDGSWEAFVGKMAMKGELMGLDREEQIVVKQQMLDRLMQLERELQERSMQAGKSPIGVEDVAKLHEESATATRNRFVVVDDRLRGDEELAIAILEKAVLGETVLDRVVLEQLKAYIRGSGGDSSVLMEGISGEDSSRSLDGTPSGDGSGDFVHDLDNSSVSSSSEEGEKFEDAYGDEGTPEAGAAEVELSDVAAVIMTPQLDRSEKHVSSSLRRTIEQTFKETVAPVSGQMLRSPGEGGDAITQMGLAKAKDRAFAKVQRRLGKPLQASAAITPVQKPGNGIAPDKATGGGTSSLQQQQSELERNATLQQQRQQLQAQLALQQQLHDELQQHLKLQQEHQQLQAQLKVKEAVLSPGNDMAVMQGAKTSALLLPPDHQCCHHQRPCPQQRQHVQQQLWQLQHQLQQAAGQTNIDSLQQAQQQAKHLAILHQKHSSLAAASTITQSTQTSGTAVLPAMAGMPPAADTAQQLQQQQLPTATKNVNVPLTGNAAALAAQKKAADLAALNAVQAANATGAAASNIPRSARVPATTATQGRGGVNSPCPNCCVDATVKQSVPRPPTAGMAAAPIDVNAETDSNHDTALTLAAAGGHARLVTLLLSRGANVEHRDKKGLSPLILAAAAGHVEVCEVLLAHKAEIDGVSDKNKDTALSLACSNGRLEVVELLLSKGANKEHRNISDYTPLSQAASGGFVNVIKVLLAHGAEINSRTGSKMGISPLMLAAMNGHTPAVKLLLDMGSDINAQIETNRNTALTLACFQGRYEVVSLLIDRKANIEHRAKTGLTPLMEAASGGYVEVGRVLLDKGADIAAAPVPVSRDTALTIAADKGHHRFVELLLSRGAVVDVKNKKGNTPLWLACNGGHVEVVQLLVAAGSDVHSEDHRHVSCIMAAFRKAHIKVVKVLVRHVTQFPPDQDCKRYIATLTDKEMIKRCNQCLTLIVTAKEQQAAEANKNAAILLDELNRERAREETKRAAAARKRDRKKLKKKEKADREKDDDKNSPDGNQGDTLLNGDGDEADNMGDDIPSADRQESLSNGYCGETSELILPLTSCPSSVGSTAKVKDTSPANLLGTKNVKNDYQTTITAPCVNEVVVVPADSTAANSSLQQQPDNLRRNRRNRRDRHKNGSSNISNGETSSTLPSDDQCGPSKQLSPAEGVQRSTGGPPSLPPPISLYSDGRSLPPTALAAVESLSLPTTTRSNRPVNAVVTNGSASSNRDALLQDTTSVNFEAAVPKTTMLMNLQPSSLTGIGDLDDFGSLSIASTTAVKPSTTVKKSVEKPRITLVEHKGPLPAVKRGTVVQTRSGTKKGQRREDDWEEVSRKSKRLLVPANAISRVIGRGGCNINAIRDISTAQVEIDRSRDSTTERIITIKGSVEAARYAQTLIEALINDTDKKFEQQLPKLKPLQSGTSGNGGSGQKQKTSGTRLLTNGPSKDDPSKLQRVAAGTTAPVSSFPIGAWGQPPSLQSKVKSAVAVVSSSSSAGGSAATAALWNGDSRGSPEARLMSYSDRAKAAVAVVSAGDSRSWSPPTDKTPLASSAQTVAGGCISALVVSLPSRAEPQPLPIVTTAGFPIVTSAPRFLPPSAGVVRDYSPFDNALSQIAESVLAKRSEDFASVAAAGIITASPPLPTQFSDDSIMSPAGSSSLQLMAKAPGYKPPTSYDLAKAPGHRVGKDTPTRTSANTSVCVAASSSDAVFHPTEYGRPSSTPAATIHSPLSVDDSVGGGGPIGGHGLGASLDRPASFYGGGVYMPGGGINFTQPPPVPPPGLMHFRGSVPNHHETAAFVPSLAHQFGGSRSLGSAVSETSVLAAPLMATSVASVSQPGCIENHLVMPTPVPASAPSAGGYACLQESYAEANRQSPVMASEPGANMGQMMEDRKSLGPTPIGTERAARRPPPPQPQAPTSSYHSDFGYPGPSDAPSMWPFTTDVSWGHMTAPMFGGTLADQSAMFAAAGFQVDDSVMRSQPTGAAAGGLHIGYHGLNDMNAAMMMSDVYHVDPSTLIDHTTMQQMLHAQNQQAMMMPSAMFAGSDMSASYSGMLGQIPPSFPPLGNAGFMMASEDTSNMWSSTTVVPEMPHYLGPKGPQLMWNQTWTPSANM